MKDSKGPTFDARRVVLAQAAQDLAQIADIVGAEAIRMAAAQRRFAERSGIAKRKASRK